jgi:hypothetical protein
MLDGCTDACVILARVGQWCIVERMTTLLMLASDRSIRFTNQFGNGNAHTQAGGLICTV